MSGKLRRRPFLRAEADALAAFCGAHGPYDGVLARRILVDLTSDPAGVIVLTGQPEDDGAPFAVAAVVDRAVNQAGAANLELLGARRPLTGAELAELFAAPALAFVRAGARRALHVTLRAPLVDPEEGTRALGELGFGLAYQSYTMRRGPEAAPPGEALPPLGPAWRWGQLDDGRVAATHALLADAFAGSSSLSLSPLEDFRRAVATGATTWRLLLEGDAVRGLVQVVVHDGLGELRTVARAPSSRGQGLGPRLVAEGVGLLLAAGVHEIELDVEARNDRALALYRSFGFEVTKRIPVLEKSAR